jgi:hypothetical protein
VLQLQRSVGNRGVGSVLARTPLKTAPGQDTAGGGAQDMVTQARAFAGRESGNFSIAEQVENLSTVIAIGHRATYAMDTSGDSLRQLSFTPKQIEKGTQRGFIDVGRGWTNEMHVLVAYDEALLTLDETKALVAALGLEWSADEPVWIYVVLGDDADFAPEAPPAETVEGDTPAMRKKAAETIADLNAAFAARTPPGRSALAGTPTFRPRYSQRTGWHIRITLDTEQTEVKLSGSDTSAGVQKRVDAAVNRMRATYDQPGPLRRPVQGGKNDPKAPPPPDWWVPFEQSEAVKDGPAVANAPPLPAEIVFKARPEDSHPTVVAGGTYDFKMRVHWEFGGQFGFAEAMNAGYYWELLAASSADWARLSGEQALPGPKAPAAGSAPASGAPAAAGAPAAGTAAPAAGQTAPAPPRKRLEDTKIGTGDRVTRKEDVTSAGTYEGERVGEDMSNDLDEGDYTGFAGEAVAGGFRIVSTHAISLIGDVLDYRDLSSRRVRFEDPGYYIVRCMSAMTGATTKDPDSFIRSPSVAYIPVKVQQPKAVAKASATGSLAGANGVGAYEQRTANLATEAAMVSTGSALQERFKGDPTLATRLDADPVGVGNGFSDAELLFMTLADGQRMSIDQLTKAYQAQQKADEEGGDKIKQWYGELKRDYPVGASFVVTESGQEIPLKWMVGEANDSTDDQPHWIIFDITSAQSRDRYEGYANAGGVPIPAVAGGHAIALRAALRDFAGTNPYAYGEIGLAWPEQFAGIQLDTKSLPTFVHSAPNADKRRKNRHANYVKIATLIASLGGAAELEGLAAGARIVATVLGAKNAIDALQDRSRTGHLYELSTLLDIAQVIGGLKVIGEGARGILKLSKVVKAVKATSEGIELLTTLEHGFQVINIPTTLWERLRAIDDMPGDASGVHKAALAAFAFGHAVYDGAILVHAVTAEEARYYDDSKEKVPEGQTPKSPPGQGTPPKEPDEPQKRKKDDEPGMGPPVVIPVKARKSYTVKTVPGMSEKVASTLQAMCDEHGIVMDVRPTTGTAPEWRGQGAVAKPEKIKAKTINEYDRLLGAPEGAVGLVGFFNPTLPARPAGMDDEDWGRVQARYKQRAGEYKSLGAEMAELERQGIVKVEDGVVKLLDPRVPAGDRQYAPVTGDQDLFDINWADGRKMTDLAADQIARILQGMGVDIEHPAHMRWKPTTEKDQKMYDDIVKQHSGGPDHKQNLIRFEPGQPPHDVTAGEAITPVAPQPGKRWDIQEVDPNTPGAPGTGDPGPGGPGTGPGKDEETSFGGAESEPVYTKNTAGRRQALMDNARKVRRLALSRFRGLKRGTDPKSENPSYEALAGLNRADERRAHPSEALVWARLDDAWATLRDPVAIANAIYEIRLAADAAEITPTQWLMNYFGGEAHMEKVGYDDFRSHNRGENPPIDDTYATDVHGSLTHVFQEYVLSRHWAHEDGGGRKAASDFRRAIFDMDRPGVNGKMYADVWDAVFDEDEGDHINRPEMLAPILLDTLGLPAAHPGGPQQNP